jgi:tripartite-type tricarboxylate transporter receptor subunit TctC
LTGEEPAMRIAIGLFALAFALAGAPAYAQKWPEKPVRMVLAYPAGGNSDVATRVIAPKLQEILGQPFLVENKPGARASTPEEFTEYLRKEDAKWTPVIKRANIRAE